MGPSFRRVPENQNHKHHDARHHLNKQTSNASKFMNFMKIWAKLFAFKHIISYEWLKQNHMFYIENVCYRVIGKIAKTEKQF
jgi:hypothetical protein